MKWDWSRCLWLAAGVLWVGSCSCEEEPLVVIENQSAADSSTAAPEAPPPQPAISAPEGPPLPPAPPGLKGDPEEFHIPRAEMFFGHKGLLSVLEGGLDAARGVADLVSSSLAKQASPTGSGGTGHSSQKRPALSPELVAMFFKLMGFNTSKLGAIALNALIFIAQLIGSTYISGDQEENTTEPSGTPLSWMFSDVPSKVGELLSSAQERSLPDRLIENLRESAPTTETDCVQLLLCKVSPIVWAMQSSLGQTPEERKIDWAKLTPLERMFAYLPSVETISRHGTRCEMKYPSCRLRYDSSNSEF